MDSAVRALTTRDTILMITQAAGGTVSGRTVMQKLAYFAGLGLSAELGHRPHYYGPFSSRVEDAVVNAVIAGELQETMERMPHWYGGPDILKYTYELTDNGRDRITRLIESNPVEWGLIDEAVQAILNVLPGLDQKTLSSAAKAYLIISESEEGVQQTEIPALATLLGWDLDAEQVEDTVLLLQRLKLVADPQDAAA